MEINNIVEICAPIIIAIMGLAYPIILSKVSNIGDRYNSEYLDKVFDKECLSKKIKIKIKIKIKNKTYSPTFFQMVLYMSLSSLCFLVVKFKPWFGWDNWFVNNSANLFVFIMTILLTISFFRWSNVIMLYSGKTSELLKHLKKNYEKGAKSDEDKQYILKTINEITLYAVEKQDGRIEEDLLSFYIELVISERKKYKEEKEEKEEGVEYPADFYNIIGKLVRVYTENNNNKLIKLRDSVISGEFILIGDFQKIKISEKTYKRQWYNLIAIRNHSYFVNLFWKNSHQYYRFELEEIYPNPVNENNMLIDLNEEKRKQREKERDRFLEFHYALGGLLLYSKNYEALNYIFTFTQQQPPKYELLPYNMGNIFEWFEWFSNENNHYENPIGWGKYNFPDLDNIGNRGQVVFSICKYICILFIRQFSLPPTLYYYDTTNQPHLPDKMDKLYDWKKCLEYFKFCLNKVLEDKEILEKLNLQQLYEEKEQEINDFTNELEKEIDKTIAAKKLSAKLSDEKIRQFYASSSEILGDGFKKYESIINKEGFDETDSDVKSYLRGTRIFTNKSSFVNDDIPCINYDSALAYGIVRGTLQQYIPNSFLIARTNSYIINKEDLINSIEMIKGSKQNVKIIAFKLEWECQEILRKNNYNDIIQLPSTVLRNFIFILEEKDLPKFKFKNIKEDEIKKYQLEKINDEYKIYGSVIDINLPENAELKEECGKNLDSGNLQVLEILSFITEIRFRADRKVVQIKINSLLEESGTPNTLDDLQPL